MQPFFPLKPIFIVPNGCACITISILFGACAYCWKLPPRLMPATSSVPFITRVVDLFIAAAPPNASM